MCCIICQIQFLVFWHVSLNMFGKLLANMFLKSAIVTWVNSTTNTCITAARPGHDDVCA